MSIFFHRIKQGLGFLLAGLLFVLCLSPGVSAREAKKETVLRVAFPQAKGYTMTAENGERYGLVVDFLNEIAKYTGWKYDYIDTDNQSIVDDFIVGKFDLMGGTYYSEGFEEYFAYPEHNCGYSRMGLLARKNDSAIQSYDLSTFQGKTIGIYEKSTENIRRLKEWLRFQGLDCNIKYYTHDDLKQTGNLYRFLRDGEVDLLAENNRNEVEDFYVAASFDSQAHYLVTQPGNQEILDGLNMALDKIYDSDPNFSSKMYEKNFEGVTTGYAGLNQEELDYIQEKKSIAVAVPAE